MNKLLRLSYRKQLPCTMLVLSSTGKSFSFNFFSFLDLESCLKFLSMGIVSESFDILSVESNIALNSLSN